jgi:hypothetical protein
LGGTACAQDRAGRQNVCNAAKSFFHIQSFDEKAARRRVHTTFSPAI